ncbi:MAG TPA: GFA family protein [Baekduia sp.]|jgi:hypothetical protein
MSTDQSSPSALPLTGGCGCRAVRFEIDAPLVAAVYCHCRRCQHRTGTTFQASARVVRGSVRITAGEEHLRGWSPGGLEKAFCGLCGSAVLARDRATGAIEVIRLAAVDGDPGIRPSARQFVDYAAPWEPIPDDGLPRFPERVSR